MREYFQYAKFCKILDKLTETATPECREVLLKAIRATPLEDRAYSEDDMDYIMKINIALINKFKDQLLEEYQCSDLIDVSLMFNNLYEEQNAKTPMKWYEMGAGIK